MFALATFDGQAATAWQVTDSSLATEEERRVMGQDAMAPRCAAKLSLPIETQSPPGTQARGSSELASAAKCRAAAMMTRAWKTSW